jgi:hypothetical protein
LSRVYDRRLDGGNATTSDRAALEKPRCTPIPVGSCLLATLTCGDRGARRPELLQCCCPSGGRGSSCLVRDWATAAAIAVSAATSSGRGWRGRALATLLMTSIAAVALSFQEASGVWASVIATVLLPQSWRNKRGPASAWSVASANADGDADLQPSAARRATALLQPLSFGSAEARCHRRSRGARK